MKSFKMFNESIDLPKKHGRIKIKDDLTMDYIISVANQIGIGNDIFGEYVEGVYNNRGEKGTIVDSWGYEYNDKTLYLNAIVFDGDDTMYEFTFPEIFFEREDDYEESNMEEWLEESARYDSDGYKMFRYKKGDKVIGLDRIIDDTGIFNIEGIITEYENGSDFYDYCVDFYREGIKSGRRTFDWFVPEDSIKLLYDDEPEETNYEQWLEESKGIGYYYDFKVGDRVRCIDPTPDESSSRFWLDEDYDKIYIILSINRDTKNIENHTIKINNNEPYNYRITRFEKVEDKPESSNYEEWVEESVEGNKFRVGDRVIIRGNRNTKANGKKGTVVYLRDNTRESLIDIEFDNKIKDGHNGNDGGTHGKDGHVWGFYPCGGCDSDLQYVQLLEDEPEETNYEEWLEERFDNENDFQIGDRIKITKIDPEYKDDWRFKFVGMTGTILRVKRKHYMVVEFDSVPNRVRHEVNYSLDGNTMQLNLMNTLYKFELIDQPEETNYEEWNEKRIIRYEEF